MDTNQFEGDPGIAPEEELTVTGYSQFTTPTNVGEPDIIQSIKKLELSSEVIAKAIDIHYRMEAENNKRTQHNKGLRTGKKERRIFVYVFIAFNELGTPMDPVHIASITRIASEEIEQAFNEASVAIKIDPIKYSRYYAESINNYIKPTQLDINVVENNVRMIIDTCKRTKSGQETLNNNPAKNVAVGVLCFYLLDVARLNINRNIFQTAFHLSWACINKYYKEIATLYNA